MYAGSDDPSQYDGGNEPRQFSVLVFLKAAVTAELAQKLGERIRHAVNSDHDTGNPTQPYRIAGTINQLSERQQNRARTHHRVDPARRARPDDAVDAGRYRAGIHGTGTAPRPTAVLVVLSCHNPLAVGSTHEWPRG